MLFPGKVCFLWGDHWGLLLSMPSTPRQPGRSLVPHPSFHHCLFPLLTPLVSSPRSVFWRSALTTLFLIWTASSFHGGHSSPVWPIGRFVFLASQPILCLPCPFKDCPSLALEADVKLSAFPALLCLCWLHFAAFFPPCCTSSPC